MTIENTCMLVNLQVGIWQGYKLDRKTTSKVTTEAGAQSDAARVNKHLVPKESLAKIVSAASALRHHAHRNTLPWKDNGDRLLPKKNYMKFFNEHMELVSTFDTEVSEFLDHKYDVARGQAEFRMGDLFNPDDYPSPSELRRKFYVAMDIDGISKAYDIRLETNDKAMQDRVTRAMEGLWAKLSKPLGHFAETMSDPSEKKLFHATTLSNLKDVVEIIPDLNFMDDPKLEALRVEISKMLATHDVKDLRKDKDLRVSLGGRAAGIMEKMRAMMGETEDDDAEV